MAAEYLGLKLNSLVVDLGGCTSWAWSGAAAVIEFVNQAVIACCRRMAPWARTDRWMARGHAL